MTIFLAGGIFLASCLVVVLLLMNSSLWAKLVACYFLIGHFLGERVVRRMVSFETYEKYDEMVQYKGILVTFIFFLGRWTPLFGQPDGWDKL